MNWKITILGGLAFYLVTFALGMFVTGPFIHEGVLAELYDATASFWRPELNQEPPNLEPLMPLWITTALAMAFVFGGIYSIIRPALNGCKHGVVKGIKYGVMLSLISLVTMASWSGVFNLPNAIWGWWFVEGAIALIVGCAVMGFVAQRLVPEDIV